MSWEIIGLNDKHFVIFASQYENKLLFLKYFLMMCGLNKMKLRKNRRTKWTEEERQRLKNLFQEFDGDIEKVSRELRRGERSVRMNLFFLDLIKESEVDQRF